MTPEEICQIIALHPEPVVTTADVHDKMQMSRRGAHKRLDTLVDDGYLHKKETGGRSAVYYLSDKGRQTLG
jgi:DNA-binding IclR family transcriptional regulator